MKYLYKYPQAAFPYADLVETNRRRSRNEMEYELLDTGVFNQDRYFDVFVEYAKDGPEDILVQITAVNRGPEKAELHLLPTLWFRNDWASWIARELPRNRFSSRSRQRRARVRSWRSMRPWARTICTATARCRCFLPRMSTNNDRLFPGQPNASPYVKDGINDYVVQGRQDGGESAHEGTKASAHYRQMVGPGQSMTVRLRLTSQALAAPFGPGFDETFAARLKEADEFYRSVTPPSVSPDAANVMRQALAGMLWSKQYYFFDGDSWLEEHHSHPLHAGYRQLPELGVVPHGQRGHHLDARQVGVPLVRGLGPGLPHAAALDRGPGFREAADAPDAAWALPAPQRADSRLRVELQRREPSGPRLCDPVPPPHRAGPARRDGRAISSDQPSTSSC